MRQKTAEERMAEAATALLNEHINIAVGQDDDSGLFQVLDLTTSPPTVLSRWNTLQGAVDGRAWEIALRRAELAAAALGVTEAAPVPATPCRGTSTSTVSGCCGG